MVTEIRIPTTGNAGEDAVVVEWHAAVGDRVAPGQALLSIETAKSTVDIDAPAEGTLLARHAEAGDEVAEFAIVGIIGDPGEDAAVSPSDAAGAGDQGSAAGGDSEGERGMARGARAEPAAARAEVVATAPAAQDPGAGAESAVPAAAPVAGISTPVAPAGEDPASPASSAGDAAATPARRRLSASPRARRLAGERGVDLAAVRGSGPLGRILAADVEAASTHPDPRPEGTPSATRPERQATRAPAGVAAPGAAPSATAAPAAAAPAASPTAATSGPEPLRVVPVRGVRKVTAQRMHASLTETAQVTLTRYAGADRMLEWITRLRQAAENDPGRPRVGVNDAVLYAVSRAAARHPEANSWFSWEGISQFDRVDLGFAVDAEAGLFVPVIREAHTLSVGAIAARAREAIERARAGRLSPEEMTGGTFTVSNLGGAGVHWFTPVLNPPQSCILGVGATHRVIPDAPAQLPLSLTFDHRALDGAAAAAVLRDIARAIETIDVLDAF